MKHWDKDEDGEYTLNGSVGRCIVPVENPEYVYDQPSGIVSFKFIEDGTVKIFDKSLSSGGVCGVCLTITSTIDALRELARELEKRNALMELDHEMIDRETQTRGE